MNIVNKYINIKVANEAVKTFAVLVTAFATSLAAYYSYQAVKESRTEAAYAREYAFSSEKRLMIGRLKAAAISLQQADNAYQQYKSKCCSGWNSDKKENPDLTLRYSKNILNSANNFLTILVEAGAYNLIETDYHIQEMNKWVGTLPHSPDDKPFFYKSKFNELITKLDSEYKNLTSILKSPEKNEG